MKLSKKTTNLIPFLLIAVIGGSMLQAIAGYMMKEVISKGWATDIHYYVWATLAVIPWIAWLPLSWKIYEDKKGNRPILWAVAIVFLKHYGFIIWIIESYIRMTESSSKRTIENPNMAGEAIGTRRAAPPSDTSL